MSRRGSERSTCGAIATCTGCVTVPTRFLPAGRLIAVLPPIAASTAASSVVGTRDERDAALIGRRGEPDRVADRAAADADDEPAPVELRVDELGVELAERVQRFERLVGATTSMRRRCKPPAA